MKMNSLISKANTMMAMAIVIVMMGSVLPAMANTSLQDRQQIKYLLNNYELALNASDTSKVLPLYTDDGVFMPSQKPSAVGASEVKTAYQHVFQALDLNVKFHIDEIEQYGDVAFVRTTSDGKIKLLDKNITITNNSRELFILKRSNNKWKIYRYMFNEAS